MVATLERAQLYKQLNEAAAHAPSATIGATLQMLRLAEENQLESALAARLLRVVARIVELSTERTLAEAVGAGSDYAAFLSVITQPEVIWDQESETSDPLLPARLAGMEARHQLLELGGGVYTAEQIAEVLGISRQAVDNRRKRGKLLAVTLGRRGNFYPIWQTHEGRALEGLAVVLAELHDHDPWSQLAFMLNPNTWLDDETPLEALRRGLVDQVRDAASVYGKQVAA